MLHCQRPARVTWGEALCLECASELAAEVMPLRLVPLSVSVPAYVRALPTRRRPSSATLRAALEVSL
jgi:hypothetical protein